MASRAQLLTGIGVGFGLMYLLDPGRGVRRRARLRDAAVSATHTATDAAGTTRRDLTNRIVGTAAELRGRLTQGDDVDDVTLIERVRSKLGPIVGAGGVALAAIGAKRGDVPGWLLMAGGIGLLARAGTNLETRRLVGTSPRRRAVDLQKTMTVDAPVEAVHLETGRPPHDAAQPDMGPTAFVP